MKIKGFKNSLILTEKGLIKTNLIIKDGIIDFIGEIESNDLIELDENKIIIPGFIDQHIHGLGGYDVIDGKVEAIEKIASELPKEGVTAFLPTTTTEEIEVINKSLKCINEYINKDNKDGSLVLGIHLEGPFISNDYLGAQLPEYVLKPNKENFKEFEKNSNNNIKLVTLAPEEDDDLIQYLKSKNIVVSIGHSSANYEDVKLAISKGVSCITHTFNGMKGIHHREIGTAGSALLFDELYCEVICDGIHVSNPALKLLFKNKSTDKVILISDSVRMKNLNNGIYYDGKQKVILKNNEARLENGVLVGSVLKINEAVRNIIKYTGVDFSTAIKYATINPATNLGVDHLMGSIKEGKLANLVVVDKDINVYLTIRNGNIIYQKE